MAADQPHLAEQFNRGTGSYELVLGPVLLSLIGLYLDKRFGTQPWLMILFTVFGIAGAGASAYYRYRFEINQLHAETADLRAKAQENQR